MRLFDEDKKIITADSHHIKLWEFNKKNDEAPDLVTSLQMEFKLENVFATHKPTKEGNFFYLASYEDKYVMYQNKLEKYHEGQVSNDFNAKIAG
jgi:hypothetical protein